MAGELAVVNRETDNTSLMAEKHWRWRAQYSRCFSYPSSYLSSINNGDNNINNNSSLLLDKNIFKPSWFSSVSSSTVCLHSSDHSPELFILTVALSDTLLEEHYISNLYFVWPQVSCISGFPTRGSLVVIASYIDSSHEKQKFALRFSTPSDVEDFINSLEDIHSNKWPRDSPAADVISAISSQSEFIPPYRPDTSSMISPRYTCSEQANFKHEYHHKSLIQMQDVMGEYESNGAAYPPYFTSLVSSCAEIDQDALALANAPELQEPGLKAQIAKYMKDASFLDIVSKVNEVITELGGGYSL